MKTLPEYDTPDHRLSKQQVSIAQHFIENGDLRKAIQEVKPEMKPSFITSYKYRLLKSTAFKGYLHHLQGLEAQGIIINRDLIYKKLQKELEKAEGKTVAELAKVINSMQGNSIDRKEVTIRLPEQFEQQMHQSRESLKPKGHSVKNRAMMIEESKKEFDDLLNQVKDVEFQEVSE